MPESYTSRHEAWVRGACGPNLHRRLFRRPGATAVDGDVAIDVIDQGIGLRAAGARDDGHIDHMVIGRVLVNYMVTGCCPVNHPMRWPFALRIRPRSPSANVRLSSMFVISGRARD